MTASASSAQADEHLMRAKREGRDRVVLGEPAGDLTPRYAAAALPG